MARTTGARNSDYEDKRNTMAATVAFVVIKHGADRLSLREIARETGFSVNNLRHYFTNRDGLIEAALAAIERNGTPYTRRIAALADKPPAEALPALLRDIAGGWEGFLGNMHLAGLAEGLGSESRGPSYVNHILEPTLQTIEQLMAAYVEQGKLSGAPRALALTFAAPVLLAMLHQSSLFGARCRHLDVEGYIDGHVAGFLRAYTA